MRETVPYKPFATQTAFGRMATPAGPSPTWTVWRTSFVEGSIRETELSLAFATQIASRPTATPLGPKPTGIWAATLPLRKSITPTAFGFTEAFAVDPPPCV